jgi:capsular exopolysaccharide synthesis family protein
MELRQYLQIARRWSWLLILGLVVGAVGGYLFSLFQSPVYQAATRILILRPSRGTTTSADLAYLNDQQLTQTYIQLLTTPPVLEAASVDLGFSVFARQIAVQQIGTTQVIRVVVEDSDPLRAALIANQLVVALNAQNELLQAGRYTEAESRLQTQIVQIQDQINALQLQVNQVSVQTVQEQLEEIKTQIDPLQNEVTELNKLIANLSVGAQTTEKKTQLAEAQSRLDEIEPLLTLYQKIYSDLIVLGRPTDGLVNDKSARLLQLQSTLDLYQQVYINLLSSLESLRLARVESTPNIVQIEVATTPTSPIRPQPVNNTLLAAAVGVMLAAGIVFLVEYLDNTLKTVEDVERILQLPVIGFIAEIEGGMDDDTAGVYVHRQPRSPVSEAFRLLRTNLEFAGVDRPIKRLMLTSAGPNEGKTTVAVNLAAIIGQGGRKVMLLDADLRRPRVHRFLELPNRVGLSDLFRSSIGLEGAIRTLTPLENVSVITSGVLPPNPAELLASARMDHILQEAGRQVDMVILDCPPAIVADVQVLSAKVDAVVIVIHPGHTQADAALAMLDQLKRANAPIVGVVLNRIPRDRADYYGGYHHYSPYYSGYHHYTDHPSNGKNHGSKFKRWIKRLASGQKGRDAAGTFNPNDVRGED